MDYDFKLGRGRGRGRGGVRGRGSAFDNGWRTEGAWKNNINQSSPTKQEHTSDQKMSERYNEEDADVTIISSDNVIFKVHSFPLARASPVFKSMLSIAQSASQKDLITLTDPHVELSIVVKATLDILYDHEIDSFKNVKLYQHVVEFARKWDMPIITKTILEEIRVHANISEKMSPTLRPMFHLAVDIGDHDVIISLVRACHNKVWSLGATKTPSIGSPLLPHRKITLEEPISSDSTKSHIVGRSPFALGSWSYDSFADLPKPIIWAILRAQEIVDSAYASEDSETLPKELKTILDAMYPDRASKA